MLSLAPFQFYGALVAALLFAGYLVRRAMLPKPIPGLLYAKGSANKIMGSALDLLAYKAEHGEMMGYMANLAVELNTPIFQAFVHPFGGKPWVVIADHREANDILSRRTSKDFDRSKFLKEVLMPLSPEFNFHLPTGDRWKAHRKLIADTMSPAFLGGVAAPNIWNLAMSTIELWQAKAQVADGRPFAVMEDIRKATFEILWTATFGFETGAIKVQKDFLRTDYLSSVNNGGTVDEEFPFPRAEDPPICKAALSLTDALKLGLYSPSPRLVLLAAYNLLPSLRSARDLKEAVVDCEIRKSIDKFSNPNINWENEGNVRLHTKSAVDNVVARELESAKKEGRAPEALGRVVKDELFSFTLAGNELSTLCAWALKFATAYQDIQSKLRDELEHAFKTGTTPTPSEIQSARLPYLEAFIDETLRVAQITETVFRTTQHEVDILGHTIPKDTEVLILNNGPGTFTPPLAVDESKRSKSSQANKGKVGEWDPRGMRDFDPERWLVKDEQGRTSFNASAGTRHSFGAGPRGCFGRKWAALQVRIVTVLILWHFELEQIPEALASFKVAPGIAHRPEMMFIRPRAVSQDGLLQKRQGTPPSEDSGVEF